MNHPPPTNGERKIVLSFLFVELSWHSKTVAHAVVLLSDFAPDGLEEYLVQPLPPEYQTVLDRHDSC